MELLSTRQVSRMLGVSVSTLKLWRQKRIGPPFVRCGSSEDGSSVVRYPFQSLEQWVASRTVNPLTDSQVVKSGGVQGTPKQVPVGGGT